MSLLASPPQDRTPWRHLILAMLAALAIPPAIGATLMGLALLSGGGQPLQFSAMMLVLSPLLAGAGMVLVLPFASLLIRLGWFGYLPAALLGLGVGAAVGLLASYPMATPFGLCSLLILRAILGRLRPMEALA